jgi:anti-anti-sigma regulatory factor
VTRLDSREEDGFAIVALPADFDQNDWLAFRGRVNRDFIDRGLNRVIVDCSRAQDLPSIAYGSLTSLSRDFLRINGLLLLIQVSRKDRAVLRRTGIDQFLPIYGTMGEALRRQAPAAPAAPPPPDRD